MFQTASGVSLPFPEKLRNEYQTHPCFVQLTPSYEKIQPLLLDFIAQLEEPLFVVLEMPVNREEEELLRKQDTDPFHKKACYLDGQSQEQVLHIIAQYGEILLNDGLSQFAVASHVTGDEFFIQKYKRLTFTANQPTTTLPCYKSMVLLKPLIYLHHGIAFLANIPAAPGISSTAEKVSMMSIKLFKNWGCM